MQTVLITGANGFLGYYLTRLLNDTCKVVATGKGVDRLHFDDMGIAYEEMDITSELAIQQVFQKHRPDVVVHCAALSKPDDCELHRDDAYKVNVTATQQLVEASKAYQSFFIFLSTDFIFDGERGMYSEDDIPAPVNYYGQTKLLAETAVKDYAFPWAIVRTVLVYGKANGLRDNIVTMVAKALHEERPLKIFNDQVRTPTFVEDLVRGIEAIIVRNTTGVFHISGKDVLTPFQIAVAVARYLALKEELITSVTESEFSQPARRPPKTGFNIGKAEKMLDYKPISFSEGLMRTFKED